MVNPGYVLASWQQLAKEKLQWKIEFSFLIQVLPSFFSVTVHHSSSLSSNFSITVTTISLGIEGFKYVYFLIVSVHHYNHFIPCSLHGGCVCFCCLISADLFNQSIHWHVQNAVIPCHSQEALPFLPVIHFFLPLLSADRSSILHHFIQPSISWSTSWSCCFQIHIQYSFGNPIFFHSLYMSKPT